MMTTNRLNQLLENAKRMNLDDEHIKILEYALIGLEIKTSEKRAVKKATDYFWGLFA
jgi:hypothetical protein